MLLHLELARLEVQPAFTYVMQYIIAQDTKPSELLQGNTKEIDGQDSWKLT